MSWYLRSMRLIFTLCVTFFSVPCNTARLFLEANPGLETANNVLVKRQGSPANDTLECFQVYPPVLTPGESDAENGCVHTMTLMEYDFAFSYGKPFVGNYVPPPCSFNRVVMNFTVTSKGRQFDRLAIMYLGDVEVWRTSTAEPTSYGIIFTYVKEMQHFNALWRQPQKLIFDLGNLVDDTYTGIWHTTLTATFFTVPNSPRTADSILPISKQVSAANAASVFQLPSDNASVVYELPKNAERAVVSLSACGQGGEEFWYNNALSSQTETFASTIGSLYGGSPWREVQLLIDGQLAGVAWPFPIIFTGGIVPGFWRPIVGIDAFDLRESEIDITPWLPYLTDGIDHTFEIRVASLSDDGAGRITLLDSVPSNWLVTGKIFIFLGDNSSVVTGSRPVVSAPAPQFSVSSSVTQNTNGSNETLTYTTTAKRNLRISATVNSKEVSWFQNLDYSNFNQLTNFGFTQYTKQDTASIDRAPFATYFRRVSYPVVINSSFTSIPNGPTSITGILDRGLKIRTVGPSIFPQGIQPFNHPSSSDPNEFSLSPLVAPQEILLPTNIPRFTGSSLETTQKGKAWYYSAGPESTSFSYGTTAQVMKFGGAQGGEEGGSFEIYKRDVEAVNTTLMRDDTFFLGRSFDLAQGSVGAANEELGPTVGGIRAALGRGPGELAEDSQGQTRRF